MRRAQLSRLAPRVAWPDICKIAFLRVLSVQELRQGVASYSFLNSVACLAAVSKDVTIVTEADALVAKTLYEEYLQNLQDCAALQWAQLTSGLDSEESDSS